MKYNELYCEKIKYDNPKKVGTSYICSMGYDESHNPIYIQTPKLKYKINFDNPSYMEMSIPKNNKDFYNFLISMDEYNVKTTYSNSKKWFNKELPFEAIDDMYKHIIKPVKNDENPKFKIKVPIDNGKVQCSIYNQDRIYMDLNDLRKFENENLDMVLILHFRGLKIFKTTFVLDMYVSQVKIFLKNSKFNVISDYSIIDDDDNNSDVETIFNEEIMDTKKEVEESKESKESKEVEEVDVEKEKMLNIQKIQEEIQRKQKELENLLK